MDVEQHCQWSIWSTVGSLRADIRNCNLGHQRLFQLGNRATSKWSWVDLVLHVFQKEVEQNAVNEEDDIGFKRIEIDEASRDQWMQSSKIFNRGKRGELNNMQVDDQMDCSETKEDDGWNETEFNS